MISGTRNYEYVNALVRGQIGKLLRTYDYEALLGCDRPSELAQVLNRPRLLRRFKYSQWDAARFVRLIAARATLVETFGELKACRDPDDDEILEAAINGKATHLVTRDDDLKRDLDLVKMARRHGVRVVSVRQFSRRLAHAASR